MEKLYIDVARVGCNATTTIYFRGEMYIIPKTWNFSMMARYIKEAFFDAYKCEIYVDSHGLGIGLFDDLKGLGVDVNKMKVRTIRLAQ